jgi:hypothetical protein
MIIKEEFDYYIPLYLNSSLSWEIKNQILNINKNKNGSKYHTYLPRLII